MTLAPPIMVAPGSCACSRDGTTCMCAPEDLDAQLAALTESKYAVDDAHHRGDHAAATRHREEQKQRGARLRAALTKPTRKDERVAKPKDVPWVALAERLRGARDQRAVALADRVAKVAEPVDRFRFDGIEYDELIAIGDDALVIAAMPAIPLPEKLVGNPAAAAGRAQVLLEQAAWQVQYDAKLAAKRAETQVRADAAEAARTKEERRRDERERKRAEQWREPLAATTHTRHVDGATKEEREEQILTAWKTPLAASEKGSKKP